jgi:RNA exonuclease 4
VPIKNHRKERSVSDADTACSSSTCSSSNSDDNNVVSPRRESRGVRRNRLWRERKAKAAAKQHKQSKQQQLDTAVPLHLQSRILAMDCEMVGVGQDGLESCLARATLIDFDGVIVYDKFVQPSQPVTDYRTHVSGISAQDLEHAITLETCRAQVAELLQNHILVGHALRNDLYALGLYHSWQDTRDTAKYEPFMKHRNEYDQQLWPRKLRDLAQEHLHYDIQLPGKPHSPYEDALAALDLYKKHWRKWEKVMDYKIQRTNEILTSKSQTLGTPLQQ